MHRLLIFAAYIPMYCCAVWESCRLVIIVQRRQPLVLLEFLLRGLTSNVAHPSTCAYSLAVRSQPNAHTGRGGIENTCSERRQGGCLLVFLSVWHCFSLCLHEILCCCLVLSMSPCLFPLSFSVAPAMAVTSSCARLCVLSLVPTQHMRAGAHAHAQPHVRTHMRTFQDKAGGQEGDGDGEKDPKDEAVSFLPPLFVVR